MVDNSNFNEKLDTAFEDLFPDDLDNVIETRKQTENEEVKNHEGWFNENYTFLYAVDEIRCYRVAEREIKEISESLDVSKGVETMAMQLFRNFIDDQKNCIIELYATAALYCACKVNEVPVTPDDIVDVGRELVTRKVLLRRSKKIANKIGLDPRAFFDAENYVEGFCDELKVNKQARNYALEILQLCNDAGISGGKSPTGWAAAAIYNGIRLTESKITQSDIASVASTSEVTIRNRYPEQRDLILNQTADLDTPESVVIWTQNLINLDERTVEDAEIILGLARDVNLNSNRIPNISSDISENPLAWGLVSVRIASEGKTDPISYRVLKFLSGYKAGQLKTQARILRNRLRSEHRYDSDRGFINK